MVTWISLIFSKLISHPLGKTSKARKSLHPETYSLQQDASC